MRLHIMDDSKFDLGNFEEEYLTQAAGFVPFSEWTAQDIINFEEPDIVNSPAHYTSGRYEAIDVIEDAITEAPNVQAGYLQGQVLKYLLACGTRLMPRKMQRRHVGIWIALLNR